MNTRTTRRRFGIGASAAVALASTMAFGFAPTAFAKTNPASALKAVEAQLKTLEVAPSSSTSVSEAGSSLFYPLAHEWGTTPPWSTLSINSAAGGSSTGVTDAITGLANVGASDPPLTTAQAGQGVINIPIVVAGQAIMYNLPGLKAGVHLNLTPTVISEIYAGTVTTWNNSAIKKLNPGVKLPSTAIVTIHRSDGSGDTNLFSTYVYDGDPGGFVVGAGGPANTLSWPSAPGELAGNGNSGVLSTLQATPGGIGYLGLSYLRQGTAAGLGYALLQNGRHNFVGPTTVNLENELAAYPTIPANGVQSLIYSTSKAAAHGYPDANFEYAIVKPSQSSASTANAIKALLAWGMDPTGGAASSFLNPLYFLPMPASALKVAYALLQQIT